MSTIRLLLLFFDHIRRCILWKHYFILKLFLLVSLLLFSLIFTSKSSTIPSQSSIQQLLITRLNLLPTTIAVPPNYHDPFIYSRIEFTHSDEQRSETSRKWCQGQSKYIRPADLEPYKCINIKQFERSQHVLCEDVLTKNSCLILSFTIGQNQFEENFLTELSNWASCRLVAFDPYYQPIQVNRSDWTFYRLGLTASAAIDENSNLMTIRKFADLLHLNTRIDIFKIDIDNANEWNLLDDNEFFHYLCRNVKQIILKTKPIYSKRFQHYRVFTLKLTKCFALLHRHSRLYFLGRHNQIESEWSLTTFSLNLGLFCDEIDLAMYTLVYGHLYLINTKL